MSGMRWFRILAAAGAILLGAAGAGSAKPLLQEDFKAPKADTKGGRIVPHGGGLAWRGEGGAHRQDQGGFLVYDVRPNPEAGTIEFDLTRNEGFWGETAFSLADESGSRLLSFRLEWPDQKVRESDRTMVNLFATGTPATLTYSKEGRKVVDGILLKGNIAKGRTVHFALTWGPAGVKVYMNGRSLDFEMRYPALVPAYLKKTTKIIVGGELFNLKPGRVFGTTRSLLANFQVHDVQLKPNELNQPISSGLGIASLNHDASRAAGFSGKLVAGNKLHVALDGTTGGTGTFDILPYPDIKGAIDLDWRGWGVYLEDKAFFAEGEINLRDVNGYRVYASTSPLGTVTADTVPVETLKTLVQSYKVEHLIPDTPYYVAVYAEKRDGTLIPVIEPIQGVAMAEETPGAYTGTYAIRYRDRFARAVVVGHLAKGKGAVSLVDATTFETDPALVITVGTSPSELKADEKSVSKITVTVADANGKAVAGHKMKFLLATTSQYTGVVGGGAFAQQVGGSVKEDYWGETDLFGRVTATYVAGFAAKTAIIVARDMTSNDTGAGWVKTFIQTAAELELQPTERSAAAASGYEITVTSSDEWLTADGKSQARITARVTLGGKPVEGHKVGFGVSSGAGSVRVVKDVTDRGGEARAVYTAGTKIGMVLITATDLDVDLSGSVQIELRSDAPAKINIKVNPEKIPADGHSTADLLVKVTDINDNPNDNVEVEYSIASGGGRLRDDKTVTDRNGESSTTYVAARTPGKVTFEIIVRSTVPTPEEMVTARGLALAVTDYNFF